MNTETRNMKRDTRESISLHKRIFLLFILLLVSCTAFAQGSFMASLDKKKVSVNGMFQITYTLTNSDARNFNPPSFKDFSVISGPNQSTSTQIDINSGAMIRNVTISYRLKPTKEGSFTLGPGTATVNGKTISSNSVSIEVTKADANDQAQQGGNQDIYTQIGENLFLRLIVDKKEVYQGEQITATYKLYSRVTIVSLSVAEMPSYTGFWSQDLEVPDNTQFTPEVYEGIQYSSAVIKKDALFPQRGGDLEVDPLELKLYVRVRVNNPYDFFGGFQDVEFKTKSNSVKVKAKPLPTTGVPLSFNGAVGDYKMEVSLNKTETKADDPVTLTINVTGTGNIKMLDVPKITLPPDLEAFDPKSSEKISKKNNVISGSKSYDYLIVPRRGGQFNIPPVEFSYFDYKKGEYVTQQSPEYLIKVEGSTAAPSSSVPSGYNKEEVEWLGKDIRFIKAPEGELKKRGEFLFTSGIFAGMYAAPFLLFILLFAYKRREDKLSGNVALLKNRRANKEATKRLKKAKQYLTEQNRKAFFDEINRAIWGYLGDKLNISQAALSRDQVQKILTEKNIATETIQHIFKTLDDAEMALFAPVSDGEMNKAYSDASEILSKLDAEL